MNSNFSPYLLQSYLVLPLLLLITSITGCGSRSPKLYYDGVMVKTPTPKKKERQILIATLPSSLGKRAVFKISKGQKRKVYGAKKNILKSLSHQELKAIWIAHNERFIGAELDLKMMSSDRKTSIPITVWIDLDQSITVEKGAWQSTRIPRGAKEIEKRWKIGPLKARQGTQWSKKALRSINIALSKLDRHERSIIKGIPFVRKKRGENNFAALYIQNKTCKAFIHIYNRAILLERYTFSGEASKALPATILPILHEIGHAIHSYPSRIAQCDFIKRQKAFNLKVEQANKAKGKKRYRLGRELKREKKRLSRLLRQVTSLQNRGPVLASYLKAKGNSEGPTTYGESSDKESFAESFALYRVDPAALKRVLPKVFKWFQAKGHLKAIK